jgi:hypothetical protein
MSSTAGLSSTMDWQNLPICVRCSRILGRHLPLILSLALYFHYIALAILHISSLILSYSLARSEVWSNGSSYL